MGGPHPCPPRPLPGHQPLSRPDSLHLVPPPPQLPVCVCARSTFTDLKLVMDNRTYEHLEGRWRDLFDRIKWDALKSVAKSVAGLQGRKFKVGGCRLGAPAGVCVCGGAMAWV